MNLINILTAINSLGLIATGTLIGALVTVVVQHFLDKEKNKTDRQSALQKEIYFNLQKQTEKIFFELNLIRRQTDEIFFWLSRGKCLTALASSPIEETLDRLSSAQVYFSEDIMKKIDRCSAIFKQITDIYFEVGKKENIVSEQTSKLNELRDILWDEIKECRSEIFKKLEFNKKLI